jgi:hypothetical protein
MELRILFNKAAVAHHPLITEAGRFHTCCNSLTTIDYCMIQQSFAVKVIPTV